MTDKMKAFLESLSQDIEFIEQVTKAETPEAVIALAAEKGFALNLEDIKPEERSGEVSDEELDAVAGGKVCACVAGGGGEESGRLGSWHYDCLCWCVAGGSGSSGYSRRFCYCVLIGGGDSSADIPCPNNNGD